MSFSFLTYIDTRKTVFTEVTLKLFCRILFGSVFWLAYHTDIIDSASEYSVFQFHFNLFWYKLDRSFCTVLYNKKTFANNLCHCFICICMIQLNHQTIFIQTAPCARYNCNLAICYVPHDNDCKSYVVCQRTAVGTYVAWKMRCAFGSFWGSGKMWTCERVEDLAGKGYTCPNGKMSGLTTMNINVKTRELCMWKEVITNNADTVIFWTCFSYLTWLMLLLHAVICSYL